MKKNPQIRRYLKISHAHQASVYYLKRMIFIFHFSINDNIHRVAPQSIFDLQCAPGCN